MKTHTLLITIATALTAAAASEASAQTCRVNSGVNANGCMSYKEVYEFDYVEKKPEFPGGGQSLVNFINDHRRYPAEAYAAGIEGRVMCSFVVNADGTVSNLTVIKGVEPSLNREALRILSKMPSWSPGKIEDTAVPVRVVCAVPFRK